FILIPTCCFSYLLQLIIQAFVPVYFPLQIAQIVIAYVITLSITQSRCSTLFRKTGLQIYILPYFGHDRLSAAYRDFDAIFLCFLSSNIIINLSISRLQSISLYL
ncbi:uncharacterized protein ASCRUDRAFT_53706, partial [Ascoidea rubescens DSM 1968]